MIIEVKNELEIAGAQGKKDDLSQQFHSFFDQKQGNGLVLCVGDPVKCFIAWVFMIDYTISHYCE